jgi:hypothetical protein
MEWVGLSGLVIVLAACTAAHPGATLAVSPAASPVVSKQAAISQVVPLPTPTVDNLYYGPAITATPQFTPGPYSINLLAMSNGAQKPIVHYGDKIMFGSFTGTTPGNIRAYGAVYYTVLSVNVYDGGGDTDLVYNLKTGASRPAAQYPLDTRTKDDVLVPAPYSLVAVNAEVYNTDGAAFGCSMNFLPSLKIGDGPVVNSSFTSNVWMQDAQNCGPKNILYYFYPVDKPNPDQVMVVADDAIYAAFDN